MPDGACLRERAMSASPDFPWLAAGNVERLEGLLAEFGWLEPGERVRRCDPAGEGNMNLTLLVETGERSFVIKQARPWVERYPEIAAPWERSRSEQDFYDRVAPIEGVADRMPRIIGYSDPARLIAMEYLPGARDLTGLYAGDRLEDDEVKALADYVARLHGSTEAAPSERHANRAMRALNHEHVFVIPLSKNNGLTVDDFEPGLGDAVRALQDDERFCLAARDTGSRYLADGRHLLHGDYFPGSWLRSDVGLRIIDPEFSFAGDPELDLGFAIAHLALASCPRAQAEVMVDAYERSEGAPRIDAGWLARYAAIEVVRRLVGVAQLPIPKSLGARAALLERARVAMIEDDVEVLWA